MGEGKKENVKISFIQNYITVMILFCDKKLHYVFSFFRGRDFVNM